MRKDEYYADKLLEMIKVLTTHDDYKDFQNISEKINEAVKSGSKFDIHARFPFLTDMFFHVIAAGIKIQMLWLDWLWKNKFAQMTAENRKALQTLGAQNNCTYHSLEQMISVCHSQDSSENTADRSFAAQIEEDFKKNLDDMKKSVNGCCNPEEIKQHIISAKFQLKFIPLPKRREYIRQYIDVLHELSEIQIVKESAKLSNIIRFFTGKYENIPLNFCNDDEYEQLADIYNGNIGLDEELFKKITARQKDVYQAHSQQSQDLKSVLSGLKHREDQEIKELCRLWGAVMTAHVFPNTPAPGREFSLFLNKGCEAQMLLHNMCAWRYYRIDRHGSGRITAKHLNGKFDPTGQTLEVDYETDGIAMDTFMHIIKHKMPEYLEGKVSDTYLTSIIDDACSSRIDVRTGADRTHRATGCNESLDTPVGSSADDGKAVTLGDLIPASEVRNIEKDHQKFVLESIKKYSPELYLYMILSYNGVTAETLVALKEHNISLPAEGVTSGQKLTKREILEIIGKGGNGNYFIRELKKLIKTSEFREIPELQEIAREIIKFLDEKK